MRRPQGNAQGYISTTATVARATVRNVVEHWALAIFSLVAAGGIWFVIQDVENPRVEALVPIEGTQGVLVTPANLRPDTLLAQTARVRVRVEARENDIPTLRASDFRATVDLQGIEEGDRASLPVEVVSLDNSVNVLSVGSPAHRGSVGANPVRRIPRAGEHHRGAPRELPGNRGPRHHTSVCHGKRPARVARQCGSHRNRREPQRTAGILPLHRAPRRAQPQRRHPDCHAFECPGDR